MNRKCSNTILKGQCFVKVTLKTYSYYSLSRMKSLKTKGKKYKLNYKSGKHLEKEE